MNLHESTSFASRLPTEVLCHIFIHTLPKYKHPNLKSFPILLTKICRRWREISVDMPSLWSRMHIDVYVTHLQQAAFYYDSWLKRTRGHPISLEINCITDDYICLQTLLQPYIHQISSLIIAINNPVAPEILFNDLPALQELSVVSRSFSHIANHDTLLPISPHISRPSTLRTLKLYRVYSTTPDSDLLSRLDPVWAHLTNVEIGSSAARVVMRLLRLTPNLSSFRICNLSWQHEELIAVGSGTVGFAIGLEQEQRAGDTFYHIYSRRTVLVHCS
ncbi:hypothetical protein DEU56DRAFT_836690 [Suillus clintonianus]|uniref:uncharacterized protein n=1 Tax=Suillus clintonianus TaxID=1904413 RepID=UPI001B85ED12|nr:uncharacterized protein DEU56DRAFT_836690 [Suillus clintonianus]KAG2119330.1 hypothetical protein DEU56DRAFT_836690 [Suillus clintonianus]